jgi:hypothetical protein
MKRLAILASLVLSTLAARAELPFVENDWKKAVARASAQNVPVFVEAWAPW